MKKLITHKEFIKAVESAISRNKKQALTAEETYSEKYLQRGYVLFM